MRSVYEILRAKRDGQELTREEIQGLVQGVVAGTVPDYQTAAFQLKTIEESRALGRALVDTARAADRQATGWITDMSRPLGRAVGNALEADESIRVLRGEGPQRVAECCLLLGVEMLRFSDPRLTEAEARQRLEEALASGKAARQFERVIEFHAGDPRVVENPLLLSQPKERLPAAAPRSGFVRSIQTEKMGFLSIEIGCGRARREDAIDLAAGFLVEKTVGDRVEKGEPLAVVCLGDRPLPRPGYVAEVAALFEIGDTPGTPSPLAIEKL